MKCLKKSIFSKNLTWYFHRKYQWLKEYLYIIFVNNQYFQAHLQLQVLFTNILLIIRLNFINYQRQVKNHLCGQVHNLFLQKKLKSYSIIRYIDYICRRYNIGRGAIERLINDNQHDMNSPLEMTSVCSGGYLTFGSGMSLSSPGIFNSTAW